MSEKITGKEIAKSIIETIKIREALEQESFRQLEGFLADIQDPTEDVDELFELYFGKGISELLSEEEKSD